MKTDVVIIGGGHNGLVAGTYLAKTGLKVKIIERRPVVGGAAVTEEFHPGFRNSVCSYTVSLLNPKVVKDLKLFELGLKIVPRPLNNLLVLDDGFLKGFADPTAMRAEIARHSEQDAARYDDYLKTLSTLAGVLKQLILQTPPTGQGTLPELWGMWKTTRPVRALSPAMQQTLADILILSADEFLSRWFKQDAVKTLFAFDGVVGTLASPKTPGTAYVLLHHCFGELLPNGAWGHAIGGMGAISETLKIALENAGGDIVLSTAVDQVIIENDRACGVRLASGEDVRCKIVAANVNPKLLFRDLVPGDAAPEAFQNRMQRWACASGTLRMNVALSELPDLTAIPGVNVQDHHGSGIIFAPSIRYMEQAYYDAMTVGFSKRPIVEMLIPSTMDDTLAPPGKHVASLFCQHFNPDLPGGTTWDDIREQAADQVIDLLNCFAPNFKSSIIARQVLTPLDLEREFSLLGGDIFHGKLSINQLFAMRPGLGHGHYRMPVKGLYLCGSGAHPGGGVTGVPGHNAAREILKDIN